MSGMRNLVDRAPTDVRATAGLPARPRVVALADVIKRIRALASLEAKARDCALVVSPVDPRLAIYADPDWLSSALSNLLQNHANLRTAARRFASAPMPPRVG